MTKSHLLFKIYSKYKVLGLFIFIALAVTSMSSTAKAQSNNTNQGITVNSVSSWQLRGGTNLKERKKTVNGQVVRDVLRSANGDPRGVGNAILTHGNTVFVAGDFTEIYKGNRTKKRTYLAAFNRYTGEPLNFAPELNSPVMALALSTDKKTLYVGGAFTVADGLKRKSFAAYDIGTGKLKSFKIPSPNGWIQAIAVNDNRIYIGGGFTQVGSSKRNYVAAINATTGAFDNNFKASAVTVNKGKVSALTIAKNKLFVGGNFFKFNGTSRRGLAAVNLKNGSLYQFDPAIHDVIALAASDTQLFAAVGGPGGRGQAFNLSTGKNQWTIVSDGNFQAVDVGDGPYVYFGGHYEIMHHHSKVGHTERPIDHARNDKADRLTRHLKKNGKMDNLWLPVVDGNKSVNGIDVTSDGLYFAGDFTKVKGKSNEGFSIILGQTSGASNEGMGNIDYMDEEDDENTNPPENTSKCSAMSGTWHLTRKKFEDRCGIIFDKTKGHKCYAIEFSGGAPGWKCSTE